MPLNPENLALASRETRQTFTKRDTILYALGVGAGIDAASGNGIHFVYEELLEALPTMAVVIAGPGFWQRDPKLGITWQKVLHAEESAIFHKPFPVEGEIIGQFSVTDVYDKGASKGALVYTQHLLYDGSSGDLLATVVQSTFLRGDGGFGGNAFNPRVPYLIPSDRPADVTLSLPSRPEQALIYRLSGDLNPLHIDPGVARSAGFDRPILHGLCTYAMAGRAALASLCHGDPARLKRLDARFSSPVHPGETVTFEIWATGANTAAIRGRIIERDVVVLDNGYVEFE